VPGVIAAATGSDWNAAGSLLTFYFPVGLFVIVAGTLYLLLSRSHQRVPAYRGPAAGHAGTDDAAAGTAAAAGQDVRGDGRGVGLRPEAGPAGESTEGGE
jgi:hypothetical protein